MRISFLKYIDFSSAKKYMKEIKSYLFLLIIPIIVMLLLYIGVHHIVTEQIKERADIISENFFSKISTDFENADAMTEMISSDKEFTDFLSCPTDEIFNYYPVVNKLFTDYVNINPSLEHIYLVRKTDQYTASDTGLISPVSFETLLKQTGITQSQYDSPSDEPRFTLFNAALHQPSGICHISDAPGNDIGFLIITFDIQYLHNAFNDTNAAICTIFNDSLAISSYLNVITPEKFDNNFSWSNPAHVEILANEPVTCIYKTLSDYTFLIAISNRDYYKPLYLITFAFIILIIAEFVILFTLLYRVSKRRYDNIMRLAGALSEKSDIGYDNSDIYQTIYQSMTSFQAQKEKFDAHKKEFSLMSILNVSDPMEINDSMVKNAGLSPESPAYCVISFFVDENNDIKLKQSHSDSSMDYLSIFIHTTIKETLDSSIYKVFFCSSINTYIAVIGFDGNSDSISNLFDRTVISNEIINSTYNISVSTAVSSAMTSIKNLPAAYQETLDLHRFAISVSSPVKVLSSHMLRHGKSSIMSGDFIRQRQTLLNAITAKKYDVIPAMAEALISTHVIPMKDNIKLASNRLDAIRYDLIEGVRTAPFNDFDPVASAEKLRNALSSKDLIECASEEYKELSRLNSENVTTDYLKIATEYISENLSDQNLSVALICEIVGISVQRLTKLFQGEFNMPIGEYVNTCRIEKAKLLLKDTDMTISQISTDVGFTNLNTLVRNFKKREGLTPTEYRLSHT